LIPRELITIGEAACGVVVIASLCLDLAYWWLNRRFQVGDAHALDGIVRHPVVEQLVVHNVAVWTRTSSNVARMRSSANLRCTSKTTADAKQRADS
jgi:hypothetical protein